MAVDGLHGHAPVQMVHAVRRRGDVVATAWTVVHDGAEPALTLYITGELDLDTVAELKPTLLAHASSAAGHVTVDLSDVTFMGADGFGLLHELRDEVRARRSRSDAGARRVGARSESWPSSPGATLAYDRWVGATAMPERSRPAAERPPRSAQGDVGAGDGELRCHLGLRGPSRRRCAAGPRRGAAPCRPPGRRSNGRRTATSGARSPWTRGPRARAGGRPARSTGSSHGRARSWTSPGRHSPVRARPRCGCRWG